jgi:excisionase family DNA binding protein
MSTFESHRLRRMTPFRVPEAQHGRVIALKQALETILLKRKPSSSRCRLVDSRGRSTVIPLSVLVVLQRATEVLASGDGITLVSVGRELTTQEAAGLLNVSRQYLVRLLEAGRLPFRKTGKHRRVKLEDLMRFKAARDQSRRVGLRRLTRHTEEFGGYQRELK